MSDEPRLQVRMPPASFVSWLTLLGLAGAIGTGGIGYGILMNKVDSMGGLTARVSILEQAAALRDARLGGLEAFQPLTVDRRLGAVEAKLSSIEAQLTNLLREIRGLPSPAAPHR